MVDRVVFPTRCTYKTLSNQTRQVRTPGNRLVLQRIHKYGGYRRCGETGKKIQGIPRVRPIVMRRVNKSKRRVARAYGGHFTHKVVQDRILRAFLFEEKRCVRAVQQEKLRQKRSEEDRKAGKRSGPLRK